MIENDEDLLQTALEVSDKIQQINDYLGDRNHSNGAIRFPRGYLRTCVEHRQKYSFIADKTLKSNIAYTLLLTDLFRWLLNRTDISGQAKEMLIKKEISSIGSIVESVTKCYLRGQPGASQNYKCRTQALLDEGAISERSKGDLDWIWDVRNREHLMLLKQRDWQQYEMSDCNRAIRALHIFRDELDSHSNMGGF